MSLFLFAVFLLNNKVAESRSNRTAHEDVFPSDYQKYEAPIVDAIQVDRCCGKLYPRENGGHSADADGQFQRMQYSPRTRYLRVGTHTLTHGDQPVKVYLALSIMDVDNINEETMDFSIQMYMNEIWKDPRMNLSRFIANESVLFPHNLREHIWSPDLIFDNAKSGELFKLSIPNIGIRVLKGGEFHRSSRYNLKVGCQMVLKYYPMDTQHCFLKTALFSNPDHKAELHWTDEDGSPYQKDLPRSIAFTNNIEPLKYMLSHPQPHKQKEYWASGNFTYLYANFTFIRRLSGNLVNMYIPSTLVVVLSWFSFWLDVAAVPARVTLGVTSLLTLATQVVQARGLLPPVNYMTALDVWLFVCILMVFSSILEFAVANHLNSSKKEVMTTEGSRRVSPSSGILTVKRPTPLQERKAENNFVKEITNYGSSDSSNSGGMNKITEFLYKVMENFRRTSSLDSKCRKLFPSVFLTFAAFYWIYYLKIKE